MAIKDWDEYLNDLLGDYEPEGLQPDWNEFSNHLDNPTSQPETNNPSFDENLKDSIHTYKVPGQAVGWDRIQSSLDAADKKFDENIRKRIAEFEPKYDPRTWPLFIQRLADSRFLGAKLIAVKVIEVAAVVLILFTLLTMGRMGKLPFDTPLYSKTNHIQSDYLVSQDVISDSKEISPSSKENPVSDKGSVANKSRPVKEAQVSKTVINNSSPALVISDIPQIKSERLTQAILHSESQITENIKPIQTTIQSGDLIKTDVIVANENLNQTSFDIQPDAGWIANEAYLMASADVDTREGATDYLETLISPVVYNDYSKFPYPTFIKERKRAHTEFGILAQGDYNRLRMPEDQLYSAGRNIVFPQQGLPSKGYGGGFTIGRAFSRWAFESGIIYSAKTFMPGRKLAVGTAFNNGVIEFEAMRLQLVTAPLLVRYKIENRGPLRFYSFAGFGLNLIVQSNIDVVIKYHFPSLSAGQNPNNDPSLDNTIKETRRIVSHIRDGAPFSTKSFFSGMAGLGAEYSFNEHHTLFLQTAAQYQIPNLKFSNNDGKHIRSISIQAGVRTPLGN
jgi:hypothetical protein